MSVLDTISIDFFPYTIYDPKLLLIYDNSNWLTIEADPATIAITLPGSTTPKEFPFVKGSINTFNSHLLGLSCLTGICPDEEYVYLPDGIYTITLTGTPTTYTRTRYYLKTDVTQQRLDKILIDSGFTFISGDKKIRDKVLDVKILINVAEAHLRRGEVNEAKRYLDIAIAELNKLEDCI